MHFLLPFTQRQFAVALVVAIAFSFAREWLQVAIGLAALYFLRSRGDSETPARWLEVAADDASIQVRFCDSLFAPPSGMLQLARR